MHRLRVLIALQLSLDQIRQRQPVEHDVEQLIPAQLKAEAVLTVTILAGLAARTTRATVRPFNAITLDKLLVAGMHSSPSPAVAVPELRLSDIVFRQRNAFTAPHISD